MTSSVVFGAIVVMWAVVLIPMWLRRHDEAEETRSVDRFSQAMHTLSRREAATKEKRYVVMPNRVSRARDHEVHVSGASANGRRAPRRRPGSAATTAAERRRRTLAGLLAMTVLTLMLAVFVGGMFLIALQVIVDAALVAFVLHLRKRARHAAMIRPSRRPVARPAVRYEAEVDEPYEDEQYAAPYDEQDDEYFEPVAVKVSRPAQPLFDQTAVGEPTTAPEYAPAAPKPAVAEFVFDQAADYEPVVARSSRYDVHGRDIDIDIAVGEPAADPKPAAATGLGGRPWEPVPVPKPVYASKPAAPARPKRAPIFEPLLPPIDATAELDPVDDLEEILDRRWAVND